MGFEQIWAPWRLAYVNPDGPVDGQAEPADGTAEHAPLDFLPDADPECFLCQAVADLPQNDRARHVVFRGENVLVVLNKYPYNNGHLLVAPRRHVGRLDLLTPAEHVALMDTLARLVPLLERLMNAEGFNVGLNMGAVAGAGLPGHLHWHLVPRWSGDTNFMPVFAGIKVIPQSLDALWELLHAQF